MEQIETLGARLRTIMQERKLNYDALGKLLDMRPQTLNRYVLGQREPKASVVMEMAARLGVDERWLQGYDVAAVRQAPEGEKMVPVLGVIRAGKKTGKTTITITLNSGRQAVVQVKVQKGTVRTTKLTGLPSRITMKKGSTQYLKPVRVPFTSGEKITCQTSSKKVAVVSKTGKITAKKKGKAVITVRSGKKKVNIKVTVK